MLNIHEKSKILSHVCWIPQRKPQFSNVPIKWLQYLSAILFDLNCHKLFKATQTIVSNSRNDRSYFHKILPLSEWICCSLSSKTCYVWQMIVNLSPLTHFLLATTFYQDFPVFWNKTLNILILLFISFLFLFLIYSF